MTPHITPLQRCYATATGLRIGCAWSPPVRRELGVEAERIQSVLLRKPSRPWWRWLLGGRHA